MKKIIFALCLLLGITSCTKAQKTEFSPEALAEEMLTQNGEQITFEKILKTYQGKTIVITGVSSGIGSDTAKLLRLQGARFIGVDRNDPMLTEESVSRFCQENLTGYKRPKYIEFRDELPKSNVGKILRRELRNHK